jgi:PPM family protein phosphatase
MSRTARVEFGHGSHTGLRRDHNEDTYCADGQMGLWLVADGMGGHDHGEVASALAREYVVKEFAAGKSLTQSIVVADQEIMRHSVERRSERPMGTTVVALSIKDQDFEVAWVGDSRAYLHVNNELRQLSRDHSYVQELVDTGVLTPDQAKVSPHRNVVTQALGVTAPDQLRVETARGTLQPGMQFLLCSDGLTEEVDDKDIAQIVGRQMSAQETVDHLILAALDGGGSDNVTVLLLKCVAS